MSAIDIITRRGREIVRRRMAHGTYVDGFYTEDQTPVDLPIIAVVQPMNFKERMMLPEGDRTKEWISVWTVADVQTLDENLGRRADILIVDGKNYEVQSVANWTLPKQGANLTHLEIKACTMNEKTNKAE